MQEYLVATKEKTYLAPSIVELRVELIKPRAMNFQAGQFAFFNIGGPFKAYTMTSLPQERHRLRFLVKLEEGGKGSKFIRDLPIGEQFILTGPEGYFTIKKRTGDLCFVALGVGIAPFLSLVPHLLNKNFSGRIILLYGFREEADGVYREYFKDLMEQHQQFKFIPMSSKAMRLTDYIKDNRAIFKHHSFYICGKQQAVEDIENMLKACGFNDEKINTEIFLR